MEETWIKILVSVASTAIIALGGWFIRQIVKYRTLIKNQEDANMMNTFNSALDTKLKPIKEDISNMKNDIANLQQVETNFTTRLQPTQEEIDYLKDDITQILDTLKVHNDRIDTTFKKENHLENETRTAWRYRIRYLCNGYRQRGWMSVSEANQLQEMFFLYEALGGNGQTKDLYYQTIKEVETIPDAEAKKRKKEEEEE